jgi:hypothetical protein
MTTRTLGTLLFILLTALSLHASDAIQIDVRPILTARAVTTLTDGKLVPWTSGVDGRGRADGYLTLEAAVANGDTNTTALPGDGAFKANSTHPFVQLNFSNSDGQSPQTRGVEGAGEFAFPVPTNQYQSLLVFLTSSEGPSHLHFELTYSDGALDQRDILLPDYYNDIPAGDPNLFSLAKDLPKWDATGRMKEKNHHYIHGVNLHPDAAKKLVSVHLAKTAPGYLVFWGATGVTND